MHLSIIGYFLELVLEGLAAMTLCNEWFMMLLEVDCCELMPI